MLPGLVVPNDMIFLEVIRPLAAETAQCFWLIEHQSGGPFDLLFVGQNQALFDERRLDVAVCHYTDCSCWRPHTFPRLAGHLRLDEYTSFFALRRGEDEVREWAERYVRLCGRNIGDLDEEADLFLYYGDGWWEIYTPHANWRHMFRGAFPQSVERSWRKVREPLPGKEKGKGEMGKGKRKS